MQREPDLLAVHTHSRRVVGAGYVGEPCGQRLRHPSNAPVVGERMVTVTVPPGATVAGLKLRVALGASTVTVSTPPTG